MKELEVLNVLPEEALDQKTILELSGIAREGFLRSSLTDSLLEDVAAHVGAAQRVVLIRNVLNSKLGAFCCYSLLPGRLLHAQGVIVGNDLRHKGIGQLMLGEAIRREEAQLLGYHTANSKMHELGLRNGVYDHELTQELAIPLGTNPASMQEISTSYGPRLVERGRFGNGGLYEQHLEQSGCLLTGLCELSGDAIVAAHRLRNI